MAQKPRREGSKKRILTFLLANMGRIIETVIASACSEESVEHVEMLADPLD